MPNRPLDMRADSLEELSYDPTTREVAATFAAILMFGSAPMTLRFVVRLPPTAGRELRARLSELQTLLDTQAEAPPGPSAVQ